MNIQDEVLQRLQKLYGQSPESSSKRIYVLSDVDSTIEGEWEQRLRETMNMEGERLILISYKFGDSHWIGIVIEFKSNGKIKYAEYLDPISGMHSLPEDLQRTFKQVFQNSDLRSKDMLKTNDPSHSAELTIKNLHRAANPQQFLNHELAALKIDNLSELPNEITETEELISRYEKKQRFDEANREKEHLYLLTSLKDLGAEIDRHAQSSFDSTKSNQSDIDELKERLKQGKQQLNLDASVNISEEIEESEKYLNRFQQQRRLQDAEREKERLDELQKLRELEDEISSLGKRYEIVIKNEPEEEPLHIDELCVDVQKMPPCAEKTVMELLVQFGHIVPGHIVSLETKSTIESLMTKLCKQMENEKLFSDETRSIVQNLGRCIHSDDYSSAIPVVEKLLKKLRPINVFVIDILVSKAKDAADLIRDQDIVLLVGDTGSGKSTTIQFLAGCRMVKTQVEVEKGRYLDHITTEGPITNPGLKHVTSSAHMKSETRYIAPVIIPLRDVLGSYETGTITLCDTPGFGDTAGPEVDIANGVGVVEALKECKSVKILALLSSHNLGDRAQGIQKLAYKLIGLVQGIEKRLDTVLYGFTKFSPKKDIHAVLLDLKKQHVDKDPQLQSDHVFMEVFIDMLRKTECDNLKIDPLNDKPMGLVRKLRCMPEIKYPKDVFQFSMTSETQANIENQMQRDKSSITYALKQKDSNLALYYFNKLKKFHDLINHRLVTDAYKKVALEISQYINDFCTQVMKEFNRALASLDGLTDEDLNEYKSCLVYVDDIKELRENSQTDFPTSEDLMENIKSELQKRKVSMEDKTLHSRSSNIYLSNFNKLKTKFPGLTSDYVDISTYFEERFNKLVESSSILIEKNDFSAIADILYKLSKASGVLKVYFNGQFEERYKSIVKKFMARLSSFLETADSLLAKLRLENNDIEQLKNCMETLRLAKETFALQEFISSYMNSNQGENRRTLTDIYNEFILRIIRYFEEIKATIEIAFKNRRDRSLEDIKKLMQDMQSIRKISELESKTAAIYFSTVESVREKTYELQMDAEKLLILSNQQTGITNYAEVARLFSRLKNAKWINDISPGTHDIIDHITGDLIESALQLENSLKDLNVSLENPNNMVVAKEIVEKLESMRVFDNSVPELKETREKILKTFTETIQKSFGRIQKLFRLQDLAVYEKKQRLKELEDIRRELSSLHPANKYLREIEYSNIEEVNHEILDLTEKHKQEIESLETKKEKAELQLTSLTAIAKSYSDIAIKQATSTSEEISTTEKLNRKIATLERQASLKDISATTDPILPTIEAIQDVIANVQKDIDDTIQSIHGEQREFNISLNRLESIKQKYDDLMKSYSLTPEETRFLSEKSIESHESLDRIIQDTKNSIHECERNKQKYDFTERLDASMVDNALLYIDQCEKVGPIRASGIAFDTKVILEKYIHEYGSFLEHEIRLKFKNVTNSRTAAEGDFQDSRDLTRRLQELSSLSRHKRVFDCMDGETKLEAWRQEFINYYHSLIRKMKGPNDNHEEPREQLNILQATMCLDQFLGDKYIENGFTALYEEYLVVAGQGLKESYNTLLKHVSNGDYVRANMALITVQNVLNEKQLNIIKHELNSSIKELMNETKSIASWLDLKTEADGTCSKQLKQIKDNIRKIHTASNNKHSEIMKHFYDETKQDLSTFDQDLNNILCATISRQIYPIEAFLNAGCFFEAEQAMENLTRIVLNELKEHFKSDSITQRFTEIRNRLEKVSDHILKQYDFTDISTYSMSQPNVIVSRLETAKRHYSAKYSETIDIVQKKIRDALDKNIKQVRNISLNKRTSIQRLAPLREALQYLPDDLKREYNEKLIKEEERIEKEEKEYRKELEVCLNLGDEKDGFFEKMRELCEKYPKENFHNFSKQISKEVLKRLRNYMKQIETDLDNQNIQHAIPIAKKVVKYQEFLSKYIEEIKPIYDNMCDQIRNIFTSATENVGTIAISEQPISIERAFNYMMYCFDNIITANEFVQHFLPPNASEVVIKKLHQLFEYLKNNSERFKSAISVLNVLELKEVLIISKRLSGLWEKAKESYKKYQLLETALGDIKNVKSFVDMINELKVIINQYIVQLNVELTSDETIRFENKRDDFFRNLMSSLNSLKTINSELQDILEYSINIEKLEDELKRKVNIMGNQLLEYASRPKLTTVDSNHFRRDYNHLLSFQKYVRLSNFNVSSYLERAEQRVFESIEALSSKIRGSHTDINYVVTILIDMKSFAENLPMFGNRINAEIDEVLKFYKLRQGPAILMQLTMGLENTDEGRNLISGHTLLKGEDWRRRREKMQNQDNLSYVLDNMNRDEKGKVIEDNIARSFLEDRYKKFRKVYEDLISNYLSKINMNSQKEPELDGLKAQIKYCLGRIVLDSNSVVWTANIKDTIPELLAYIFAIWTLKNTQHYNTSRGIEAGKAYLLMPHAAQVIAIFRLLGLGYSKNKEIPILKISYKKKLSDDLVNNLVEIGTGEGKSVIIAVTACVFALIGADVNCSCYSDVLSKRDQNDFASLFQALGIEQRIEYGTFNKLCENFLNEQCNVREKVCDLIFNKKVAINKTVKRIRPRVLLIDEVDVFLSDKFYGGMYTPCVFLKDPSIKVLLDTLWRSRTRVRTLQGINDFKASASFQNCITRFNNWSFLFEEALKDMIAALKSYQSSTYIVQDNKIVYVEGESIADNVVRGYDTIWAYYHEHEKGNITQHSLEANVGVIVHCGTFSYAEMPHEFSYISGVTGTLRTLASSEKKILEKIYHVYQYTWMPSVFGKSNRKYDSESDLIVVTESEYFMRIRGEINVMCNAKRAILIFFESEEKLVAFYKSSSMSNFSEEVQIITETVSIEERELYVKRAATIGTVTLLTRSFGRGTDFVCRNQQLLANGGIHVLQTFFSEELSEEYQIMGRGARQGDFGSYRMILLDKDLEWVVGSAWKEELPKLKGPTLYQKLNEARNKLYESKCGGKELAIEQCKNKHTASKNFMTALIEENIEIIKPFLKEENRGANIITQCSRTVLLMDGTGSMSSLLSAAKETVCIMFERASTVLTELKLPGDAFQMQFVIYRDYDCREEGLLQSSSWETKGLNLRSFMQDIKATGGGDYEEAIEIGLWHAFQQSEQPDGISQVILIGDAPSKDKPAIKRDREASGGTAYWNKTKYRTPTHYEAELQKLKDNNIPVHTFYLDKGAAENFQKIAKATGGHCEYLDIHCAKGAELLTNFVTKEVLRKAAGSRGNDAVSLYEDKVKRKAFTS